MIEVAQGDISPSTVIHIPSIDTVIGGDIREFRDAAAASNTAGEVIETMKAKYPDYGTLTTLEFSARAAFPAA